MSGHAEVALKRLDTMMAVRNHVKVHDVVFSDFHAAALLNFLREHEQAERLAAEGLELSEKHRFFHEAAYCRHALGVARTELGRVSEGIILIREGLRGLMDLGTHLDLVGLKACLAKSLNRAGAGEEALEIVEEALRTDPNELAQRPEALRMRGEIRLKLGQTDMAESDYRDSVATARSIGAKAWELRATISLVRLLAQHGRPDQARAMLADIYGWFSEGFDTVDLKEAKALLEELDGRRRSELIARLNPK